MLTPEDEMRFDALFGDGLRERVLTDRDEDKIAEILQRAEDGARIQRELLVESGYGFTSNVKFQERARDINDDDAAEYTSLSRWKARETES